MGFFSKIKTVLFGRTIKVDHHLADDFPFDTLGKKEATSFFYKSGTALCINREAILEKYYSSSPKMHSYLCTLFKMSWVQHWARYSKKDLKISTSDHFILMSYDEEERNELLLKFAEKSLDKITLSFDKLIQNPKDKVLIFHINSEEYYDLENSLLRPESDDEVLSGGMFVRGVVPYMVFHSEPGFNLPDITLAHELTHALLSKRKLPMWLDEAIACTMEKVITGEAYYDWSLEKGLENLSYWDSVTIQQFWVGDSFFINDSQEFSYLLAQGLFNNILRDYKLSFKEFLLHARREDAGESAALKYLGTSLGDIAKKYLGGGPWDPSEDYLKLYFQ
ncbi:MAG: hypothetical protein NE334_14970 [Lentisphaeraceae bacterium]|nr:hypothetical protein [Lentisphaeraceae bacterium]